MSRQPMGARLWVSGGETPQARRDRFGRPVSRVDNPAHCPQMPNSLPSYYHMHLVSDSTGDTLTAIAKAAAAQYATLKPIEHMHPLVRTPRQLKRVLQEIEQAPGIVLHTVVNRELVAELEDRCRELNVPAHAVLQPIMQVFESYLGAPRTPTVAG